MYSKYGSNHNSSPVKTPWRDHRVSKIPFYVIPVQMSFLLWEFLVISEWLEFPSLEGEYLRGSVYVTAQWGYHHDLTLLLYSRPKKQALINNHVHVSCQIQQDYIFSDLHPIMSLHLQILEFLTELFSIHSGPLVDR